MLWSRAEVVPLSAAYPRGLFVPHRSLCVEHALVDAEPIDLHGIPRPLPTRRCVCGAIEIPEVTDAV